MSCLTCAFNILHVLLWLILPALIPAGLMGQTSVQNSLVLQETVPLGAGGISGLSLHSEAGFLWTVSDLENSGIRLITESGESVTTLSYEGEDLEAVMYMPESNSLWVAEERARELRRISLQGSVLETVSVEIGQEEPNSGPEGLALNPANGHLYVANQRNPRVLIELNAQQEQIATHTIDFSPPYELQTLSGLFYDGARQELWMLSAASQKIVVTNAAFQPLRWYPLDMDAPEGLAVDTEGGRVFIVSDTENKLYIYDIVSLMQPRPHNMADGDYVFEAWPADEPDFSYPPHMSFQMSDIDDPGLAYAFFTPYYVPYDDYNSEDEQTLGFPYNNTRRTRINGLGEDGISLINTGRGRDLGAVVLALNTEGAAAVFIDWEAETLQRNNRLYAIRLQYRSSTEENFADVLYNGNTVEYRRGPFEGHQQVFENILLPAEALNKPGIELRWKFYYTGEQTGGNARDELRLDNIRVRAEYNTSAAPQENTTTAQHARMLQNYPNPFNSSTRISYVLEEPGTVRLDVFTLHGRRIARLEQGHQPAGQHAIAFRAGDFSLSTGMYLYRMAVNGIALPSRQMLLIQ